MTATHEELLDMLKVAIKQLANDQSVPQRGRPFASYKTYGSTSGRPSKSSTMKQRTSWMTNEITI